MIVKSFDTERGCYAFVEERLQAAEHQHPALEVLLVRSGVVDVTVGGKTIKSTKGCIVAPNVKHSVTSKEAICEVWIIEKSISCIAPLHSVFARLSTARVMELSETEVGEFDDALLSELSMADPYPADFDSRIKECVAFIRSGVGVHALNRAQLSAHVHLSPSRLSHLFKAQMGTSLENFIIWERLKYAIANSLEQEINLLNAAYLAGFFDAAHFSRAYLKMFGLNPSMGYNSSTLQIWMSVPA